MFLVLRIRVLIYLKKKKRILCKKKGGGKDTRKKEGREGGKKREGTRARKGQDGRGGSRKSRKTCKLRVAPKRDTFNTRAAWEWRFLFSIVNPPGDPLQLRVGNGTSSHSITHKHTHLIHTCKAQWCPLGAKAIKAKWMIPRKRVGQFVKTVYITFPKFHLMDHFPKLEKISNLLSRSICLIPCLQNKTREASFIFLKCRTAAQKPCSKKVNIYKNHSNNFLLYTFLYILGF